MIPQWEGLVQANRNKTSTYSIIKTVFLLLKIDLFFPYGLLNYA